MMPRLTWRLFFYFSAALVVFTIVLAGLFDILLRDAAIKENRLLLEKRAQALAASLTAELPLSAAPSTGHKSGGMHMRGMQHRMGAAQKSSHAVSEHNYCRLFVSDMPLSEPSSSGDASYLKNLSALAGGTVWLVDRSTKTITAYGEVEEETYSALPREAEEMLEMIYQGTPASSEGFNAMLDAPSFTAGAPIRNMSGEVTGALLVHRTLGTLAESERSGLRILSAALMAAFLLSLLLSLLLARRFVDPLARMEKTAAELAEGDYSVRTAIKQTDEVGSLAKSLDLLAERLAAAAAERTRLEKMRREFLASVSHELRTPLTVLRGTVDLLTEDISVSEEKRNMLLAQAMSQTAQLDRLVGDLFELTRLENPDFAIEKTPGNILDALGDAVRSARRLSTEKALRFALPEALPPIMHDMDYGRIRQMFLTVLDNAVKFSPEEGRIEITAALEGARWEISIRDHGPGIDANLLPELFLHFRSHTGKQNPNGTGLGLAVAKRIAERHDILLTAENAGDGGAVFAFCGGK